MADTSQCRIIDTIAFEIGSSVGRTVRASIAAFNPHDNFALPRFLIAIAKSEYMRTKDLEASEEKRTYYRLLRYLIGNELQVSGREDQARPLQSTDLRNELEHHEPFKIY